LLASAAGALLILLAQALVWARAGVPQVTGGVQQVTVHGHDVEPALAPIGYALLALAVALLAGRGPVRRLVGVLTVFVGAVGMAVAVAATSNTGPALLQRSFAPGVTRVANGPDAWWILALVGALLATLSGAATALTGHRWQQLGQRYDAPGSPDTEAGPGTSAGSGAGAPPGTDEDETAWKALDRGEDPTAPAGA
jgi:uncharacterized membrane protein (TIGR02234 family)